MEERAKATGYVPAALKRKPKLEPHDYRYLSAFQQLSNARQFGMGGPHPIAISEVDAWCRLTGVEGADNRRRYLTVLQGMDHVYLDHSAKKAEADRKKDSAAPAR